MYKKKIAIMAVLASMVLTLCACGSKKENNKTTENTTVVTTTAVETTVSQNEAANEQATGNKTYGGNGDCYAVDIFTDEAEENKDNTQ